MSKLFRYLNKRILQRETIAKWKLRYTVKLPLLKQTKQKEKVKQIFRAVAGFRSYGLFNYI